MSGPQYPHPNPIPGSNAIESGFQIGVSPIGTIPSFDLWTTIIAQYANSPILTSWIESFNDAMDLTESFDNFYDFVWNIQTAQGWGLDVWGRIVGVSRTLKLPSGTAYLGFNEPGNDWTGFGQAPFFTGGDITTNYILTDADFRKLIFAKAAGNISDGSIPSLNSILLTLFPARGDCYVVDNQNMTMTLHFDFLLTPVELAIVETSGAIPTPVGVKVNVVQPP